MTRGIRNNNPGNIVRSKTAWPGKIPHSDSTDARFEQFEKWEYGVAALIRLLRAYVEKHNRKTIRQIMSRYAPAHENDTHGYVAWISRQTGIGPDAVFPWAKQNVRALVAAIIKQETGADLAPDGWDLAWALVYPPAVEKKSPIRLLELNISPDNTKVWL